MFLRLSWVGWRWGWVGGLLDGGNGVGGSGSKRENETGGEWERIWSGKMKREAGEGKVR